jgi:hypothetical protein
VGPSMQGDLMHRVPGVDTSSLILLTYAQENMCLCRVALLHCSRRGTWPRVSESAPL